MFAVNENYLKLSENYLFSEVGRRVVAFAKAHPGARLVRLGIGDVTRPLAGAVVEALERAAREQEREETFRGYGPEQGYAFLREAIAEHEYAPRGAAVSPDEIFISDGAKCDVGSFQEIISPEAVVAVQDPVYPVYVDSNVMAGRAGSLEPDGRWSRLVYLTCLAENSFQPRLPQKRPDVIYLCSPNNPTGAAMRRGELERWVGYAREQGCLILFDAAYEAYIKEADIPHTIYEIEGAREVAVEFRSFSKRAGFTGLRCAFAVVPAEVAGRDARGRKVPLKGLWARRQATRYNGCPYVVQRAAQATYTPEGARQTGEAIAFYMENARLIREGLARAGLEASGGVNAPYIWLKTPAPLGSWAFFDRLLEEHAIVGTPGAGFGPGGEGYLRLTAFGKREDVAEAMRRLAGAG